MHTWPTEILPRRSAGTFHHGTDRTTDDHGVNIIVHSQNSLDTLVPPKTNLMDSLRFWATHSSESTAFCFLRDGESDEICWTYEELDRRARMVAAKLQSMNMVGQRALLLYPPGLDFVAGFFGCLYSGTIAVPAYPPRRNRNMNRIQAISDNAEATAALSVHEVTDRVSGLLDQAPHLKNLAWIPTDTLEDELVDQWTPPELKPDTFAALQYTSGSTGTPKGVVLAHRNLMHNMESISYGFEPGRIGSGVFWLPTYHDMGLIGGILNPVYSGLKCILMSPLAFLQKPIRWLRTISSNRSTISGGPNFAYELCIQKVTDEQLEGLDLSSWDIAFNGAEPIRASTLEAFVQRFSPVGFRAQALYPCYGMAEATLIVTGGGKRDPAVLQTFHGKSLDEHQVIPVEPDHPEARKLVGCGRVLPGQDLRIVDPINCRQLHADRVGEIWVDSPSVGVGYWQNPGATQETFQAKLADSTSGTYLRTGDLGFLHEGELFVTGRLKDLIIIRGVNRYPQDIEQTVEQSNHHLQAGAVGCFSVDISGRERLIVVSEVERIRRKDWSDVIESIRKRVTLEHEVTPDGVILVRFGSIPKTSSGKIQRHACRDGFLNNSLTVVAQWFAWDRQTETK